MIHFGYCQLRQWNPGGHSLQKRLRCDQVGLKIAQNTQQNFVPRHTVLFLVCLPWLNESLRHQHTARSLNISQVVLLTFPNYFLGDPCHLLNVHVHLVLSRLNSQRWVCCYSVVSYFTCLNELLQLLECSFHALIENGVQVEWTLCLIRIM